MINFTYNDGEKDDSKIEDIIIGFYSIVLSGLWLSWLYDVLGNTLKLFSVNSNFILILINILVIVLSLVVFWIIAFLLNNFIRRIWLYKTELTVFRYLKIIIAFSILIGSPIFMRLNAKNSTINKRLELIRNKNCFFELGPFRSNMTTIQFEKNFPNDDWKIVNKGTSFSKEYKYIGEFDFYGYNTKELILNFEQGVLAEMNFYINANSKNDFYAIVKNYESSALRVEDNKVVCEINNCFTIVIKYIVNSKTNKKIVWVNIGQNPTLIMKSLR